HTVSCVDWRSQRHINGSGPKAVLHRALLLRTRQQILDVDLCGLFVRRGYPVSVHDPDRMIAPERSLLWINRDHWKLEILAVRLDHHAFVQHRCRQILRAGGKHLATKESG